ncbi:Uncharacterised protein [uncultured archaeon]|nr:Uncharacterised protein [uncultured archaeon]
MRMKDKEQNGFDEQKLFEYNAMETRLYGELLKLCRRYNDQLSIISVVGILELVSQEMKDLDKTEFKGNKKQIIHDKDLLDRLV